jgi:endonuclease V-like protein UPF0215 family
MVVSIALVSAKLARLLGLGKSIRSIGFDDAPFERRGKRKVQIAGVVCAGTRFEGMVWGAVAKDGFDATERIEKLLVGRKFLPQLHLLLLDGIALGGFNVVDLPRLAESLGLPCVAVMRRPPDLEAVARAIAPLPRAAHRMALLRRAGPIHHHPPVAFQVQGADPAVVRDVLARLTDTGHVPESLRLAHLIGRAVATGESGRRA